ncbi:MAG TPA: FtsH protease activity modulator HflK [Geminicoccus sp.]|uniref:FtsH protease activity modulator HflK n=1 Tax=Geminicoccus sp. TaxID=2024832 RepID=UPI002E33AB09|nr:FtsH protease activity modulator HflK [Geminicoccus sp.]HEX2527279.1 FtsH protease activity modulator HflK [Geminicoccus sp.]
MPWNPNGGGGWNGGQGGGPWAPRPGGGGSQPPDLEELIRKSQERVRQLFPGGGRPGSGGGVPSVPVVATIAGLALGAWLLSGFYFVQPEEKGVELVFGKLNAVTDSGLNYNWPWPVGNVLKPQVTRVNRVEVGFRSSGVTTAGSRINAREVPEEALMLTGDENIVDINFVVFWRISDPALFLFNIRDPAETVKAAAESAVRELVGQTPIAEATTEGRRQIEQQGREIIQNLMNEYGSGIVIDEVQLQKADPPQEVIDAFRDVQRAMADRERAQNEAEAFANDIIPRARGEAERLLQEGQAYKQEVVARSDGEAQRFTSVLEEYRKAPDVTMQRLYIETMESVLAGTDKVLVDQQNGQPVVPYLALPELQRNSGPSRQADGVTPTGRPNQPSVGGTQ